MGDDNDLDSPTPAYDFLLSKPDDPWASIASDRNRCPVAHNETLGVYQVTAYGALEEILKDWRRFSSVGTVNSRQAEILAFCDPPKHDRQRRLFAKALGARGVTDAEPLIQQRADELLNGLSHRTEMDVVEDYANPLVLGVICHLVGAPLSDLPRYRSWTKAAERNSFTPSPEDTAQLREFRQYSRDLIESRQAMADPPDDLLTAMIKAEWENADGGIDRMAETEVCNLLEFLLVAANSTTTDAIGNLLWQLEAQPDQKGFLLEDIGGRVGGAVEEILRFDGPIHALQRTVTTETDVEGVRLPSGSILMNVYGAASHDPAAYEEPDSFLINRDWDSVPHHFGFGWGTHYCLGAHLARKEIAIAIATLYRRVENLQVLHGFEPTQVSAPFLRGWERIPITFDGIKPAGAG